MPFFRHPQTGQERREAFDTYLHDEGVIIKCRAKRNKTNLPDSFDDLPGKHSDYKCWKRNRRTQYRPKGVNKPKKDYSKYAQHMSRRDQVPNRAAAIRIEIKWLKQNVDLFGESGAWLEAAKRIQSEIDGELKTRNKFTVRRHQHDTKRTLTDEQKDVIIRHQKKLSKWRGLDQLRCDRDFCLEMFEWCRNNC